MFIDGKKPVEAKRIGHTLVAAFRTSKPALVWTFDLERNHSFTLALQGDEGDLELGVTSPKGEFYPVARFAAREDADLAFATVQKVLMKKKGNWLGGMLKAFAALVLLLLMILIGAVVFAGYRGVQMVSWPAAAPAIKNGLPMPADQVLKPPD